MYKWNIRIMLVDNNPSFSRKVEKAIEIVGGAFRIVFKGKDAGEALMHFPSLQPDMVIADTRMPGIDGIALIRIIKEDHPDCVCVLVDTNIQNTNIAFFRRVVLAHGDDLLNLDMSEEDISAALASYVPKIQRRRENQLCQLLAGGYSQEFQDLLHETLPFNCAPVLLCTNRLTSQQITTACERTNQVFTNLHVFPAVLREYSPFPVLIKCVFGSDSSMRSPEERQADILLLSLITSLLGYTPYLFTLEPDSADKLNQAFHLLCDNVFFSISIDGGRPVRIPALNKRNPEDTRKEMMRSDDALPDKELAQYARPDRIEKLMHYIGNIPLTREVMYRVLCDCVRMMRNHKLLDSGVDLIALYQELYRIITQGERLDETAAAVSHMIMLSSCANVTHPNDNLLLGEITAYLRQRVALRLSRDEIAAAFSLSGSQLSRLIKKEKNATFMHFFMQLKMDEAKTALLGDQRIAEIANMVGFSDALYFSRVFKQYCGESPTEYRKRNSVES